MKSTPESIRIAYDLASEEYARTFIDELDWKPFDRELLQHFVKVIPADRPVLDIGCGPGHTTDYLSRLGLSAIGLDLSPKMIHLAQQLFPRVRFEVGDFFKLPRGSASVGGILAFYCIVHLQPQDLVPVFSEMNRVIEPGGTLLLSFHVGTEVIHVDKFLGTDAVLDFTFFTTDQVRDALGIAGFSSIDARVRDPYESEHPSQRCYVLARK